MILSFDLDSTLCQTGHRAGLINRDGPTDWDAYSMACVDDTPGPAMPLAQAFQQLGATIVVCSARSVCAREVTEAWLERYGVKAARVVLYDEAIHGDGYSTGVISHIEWKAQAVADLNEWCKANLGEPITLHVDDWPSVKTETEALCGVPTVIVHATFEEVGYDRN